MSHSNEVTRRGRKLALGIAGIGVAYIIAIAAGGALGLSPRMLGLIDLLALAGFGWAIWQAIVLWRDSRDNGD